MKKNRKATMLIELSVLIVCSMIFYSAVYNLLSSRNYMVTRLIENNTVLMVLDSIAEKIKYDLKTGISPEKLDFSKYKDMIKDDSYKLKIRLDNKKIDILLGVYYKEQFGIAYFPEVKRIYKKEVSFNE
ncbi:MAG: hypothetical protein IKO19_04070 [Candidatus Riflebacteria bacterium]|nr:hypothetical protein [Candidatus Riflebacteria bacterium]